jgi:hypothetical protein
MITIRTFVLLILAFTAISSHIIKLDTWNYDYRIEFNNDNEIYLLRYDGEDDNRCLLNAIVCTQFPDHYGILAVHFCHGHFFRGFTVGLWHPLDKETPGMIELSKTKIYWEDVSTCKFEKKDLEFLP